MIRKKFNLLFIFIIFDFVAHSQWIDNNLNYLNSLSLDYWRNSPEWKRYSKYWKKIYTNVSKFPSINIDAAIMLKTSDSCECYLPHNDFIYLDCDCQESSLKYVPNLTFYYHLSHAMSEEIKSGKLLRFIAFRIDSLPPIGETATFEFLLLNQLKEMSYEYVLDAYFSEEIKFGKLFKIKNQIYSNGQLINEPAEIGHGFEIGKTTLKIDEKTSKYKWLILVDPVRVYSKGYILPRNMTLNEINVGVFEEEKQKFEKVNSFVQFDVNSYFLNENEKDSLNQILNSLNIERIKKITLMGQADNTGNFTQNVFLAYQRSEVIKDFLITLGLDEKLINIAEPSYQNDPKNKFSRGCFIQIVMNK